MLMLVRGQKIKLSHITSELRFEIAISCDMASSTNPNVVCLGLDAQNKFSDANYLFCFNHPQSPCGAVKYTENKEQSYQQFQIDLSHLPDTIQRLVFLVSVNQDGDMSQIENGYLKFFEQSHELSCFSFSGNDFDKEKAVIIGEIYFKDGWRFAAVGQGFNGGIGDFLKQIGEDINSTKFDLINHANCPAHSNCEAVGTEEQHEDENMASDKTPFLQRVWANLTSKQPDSSNLTPSSTDLSAIGGGLFQSLAKQAEIAHHNWEGFYTALCAIDQDSARKKQFAKLDQEFRTAIQTLYTELTAPELRIATTGTTSSGKSSIVNLLAGALIMPVEEREMSAGVVILRYSANGLRRLKITKTTGAKWQCGEWNNLTDAEIKERLTKAMHDYNDARNSGAKIIPPEVELEYPLACFKPDGFLHVAGLPEHTKFVLIDLPGLRNVTDDLNREIVQRRSREALCLVAYNMAETDEVKRQSLVQEVLKQIKTMGGSPARMLFVLNRIDVFHKDGNWEKVQREEIDRRRQEITTILSRELPEHRKAIGQLTFARLSSAPALCSRRMIDHNFSVDASTKLDGHYSFLIPREIIEDLPRRIEKWEMNDIQKVSKVVWENSYGAEFSGILRDHIEKHFATLVLPPIVKRFEAAVNKAVSEAANSTHVTLEMLQVKLDTLGGSMQERRQRYEEAKKSLYATDSALKAFLGNMHSQLLEPLKKRLTNPTDFAEALELTVEDWAKTEMFSNSPSDALSPLYNWKEGLSKAALDIVKAAVQSLVQGGIDFSGTSVATMPDGLQKQLSNAITQFQYTGYDSECATATGDDQYRKVWFESKKEKLRSLRNGAARFSEQLTAIIQELLARQTEIETGRIQDALQSALLPSYTRYLNKGLKEKAPKWGLNIPHLALQDLPLLRIGKPTLTTNVVNVQTVTESNPWTLWVADREVSVTIIPNAVDLANKWNSDIQQQMDELLKPFSSDLGKYLRTLQDKTEQMQQVTFKGIEDKYDQFLKKEESEYSRDERTSEEKKQQLERTKSEWDGLQKQAKALGDALNGVKKVVGI